MREALPVPSLGLAPRLRDCWHDRWDGQSLSSLVLPGACRWERSQRLSTRPAGLLYRTMESVSETPGITLQIVYRPPPREEDASGALPLHKRRLGGVPRPTAGRMLRDFSAYQANRDTADQRKAYTYRQRSGNRRSRNGRSSGGNASDTGTIALDFGEIVALTPIEEEVPAGEGTGRRPMAKSVESGEQGGQ